MLILFEGDGGSGKTYFTTFLAISHQSIFDRVLANYTIRGIKNFKNLELEDLRNINQPTLVIIDEAYSWAEARNSMDLINLYLSYHLFQKRKRGIIFLLTAQLAESIDVRFRKMCNVLIECEFRKNRFHYQPYVVKRKQQRRTIKKRPSYTIPLSKAEILYPFYNTNEIVETDKMKDAMVFSMSREKRIQNAQDIMQMIWNEEHRKYTRPEIRAFLFDNNFSMKYEDSVYYGIIKLNKEQEKITPSKKKGKKQTPKEILFNAFRGD